MARCPRCKHYYREPPGEEGDHDCPHCGLRRVTYESVEDAITTRDDKISALREMVEAMRKQLNRQKTALLALSAENSALAKQVEKLGGRPDFRRKSLEQCFSEP